MPIQPDTQADRESAARAFRESPVAIGNVKDAVIQLKEVNSYTTFRAEYALIDGDIVVHFFPPREAFVQVPGAETWKVSAEFLKYWKARFPLVLSPVAEEYFEATKPRVVAQYTPEMTSWWMRCYGFAVRIDPDGFILSFFEKLDRALDAASAAHT